MPLNLATTATGFTEAMQLVHKGEKAMLWLPPTIGLKEQPQAGKAETLVYEVEVVDIDAGAGDPDRRRGSRRPTRTHDEVGRQVRRRSARHRQGQGRAAPTTSRSTTRRGTPKAAWSRRPR